MLKQPFFPADATCISNHGTIGSNNPVAWNNDRDFIFTVTRSSRTYGLFITHPSGQLQVAYRRSKRNGQQLLPHCLLKRGAGLVYGHRELLSLSFKIFG